MNYLQVAWRTCSLRGGVGNLLDSSYAAHTVYFTCYIIQFHLPSKHHYHEPFLLLVKGQSRSSLRGFCHCAAVFVGFHMKHLNEILFFGHLERHYEEKRWSQTALKLCRVKYNLSSDASLVVLLVHAESSGSLRCCICTVLRLGMHTAAYRIQNLGLLLFTLQFSFHRLVKNFHLHNANVLWAQIFSDI